METVSFTLFDTSIGRCAIAWSERGIASVQLPEADDAKTRARIRRRFASAREAAPNAEVASAISAIAALLAGEPSDLGDISIDMTGIAPFERRVYEIARTIPPGEVITYGEVARRLGEPGAARAVGQALGKNPFAIVVPCHRVVGAGTNLGGFSANGDVDTKRRMLAIERSPAAGTPDLFAAR